MQRVTFRIPDDVHARAKDLARDRAISLNQLLVELVAAGVSGGVAHAASAPPEQLPIVDVQPDPKVK